MKQTSGFAGVPEAVWNFHIGDCQVCERWLKELLGPGIVALWALAGAVLCRLLIFVLNWIFRKTTVAAR